MLEIKSKELLTGITTTALQPYPGGCLRKEIRISRELANARFKDPMDAACFIAEQVCGSLANTCQMFFSVTEMETEIRVTFFYGRTFHGKEIVDSYGEEQLNWLDRALEVQIQGHFTFLFEFWGVPTAFEAKA